MPVMRFGALHSFMDGVLTSLLFALSLALVTIAYYSLQWPMGLDAPILMYGAWLVDACGQVPYRDFFEMNMPGTYAAFYGIVHFFGTSDLQFRLADLTWLAAIMGATACVMRHFGWAAVWIGMLLFPFAYLGRGPYFSMQRDFMLMLPVILGVGAAMLNEHRGVVLRTALCTLFFALAATIKPHAAVGLPLCLVYIWAIARVGEGGKWRWFTRALVIGFTSVAVFGCVYAAMFLALWWMGALGPFLDIASNYWPLYGSLTAKRATIAGAARWMYIWNHLQAFGGLTHWLLPALFGSYVALGNARLRVAGQRRVLLLLGLTGIYALYPAASGQFYGYHWIPLIYFLSLLAALGLTRPRPGFQAWTRLAPLIIVLAFAFSISQTLDEFHPAKRHAQREYQFSRPAAIADYLTTHQQLGDTVQNLDWAWGGTQYAMLKAEARLATPFIYAFHFYHHVSNPYIKHLRARFLESMETAQPRFVINVQRPQPWVRGADTVRQWPRLEEILRANYRVVKSGYGYQILERRKNWIPIPEIT